MFELEKASLFFESMASDHPTLVQNIEIVHENKTLLGASYHTPKRFILHLNNLFRSIIFFVESSQKNSPKWLRQCIKSYKKENFQDYVKIKRLRDVSAHQALIFPQEALVAGLYRIKSERDYTVKIGIGDTSKPKNYSWDLAMKDTDEIFHDLLVFHSMVFMDLDHSAYWECLGITRKWLYKLKYDFEDKKLTETVDVFDLVCIFASSLLDCVCEAYAKHKNIKFQESFHYPAKEYNNVNTLLEIDLYPSLFSKWWDTPIEPLNFGVRNQKAPGESLRDYDFLHSHIYDHLCDSPEKYLSRLESIQTTSTEEWIDRNNIGDFYTFIHLNHWHAKNSFKGGLMDSPIEPHEVMQLQRLGKAYLAEEQKGKLCAIQTTAINFQSYCSELHKKISSRL